MFLLGFLAYHFFPNTPEMFLTFFIFFKAWRCLPVFFIVVLVSRLSSADANLHLQMESTCLKFLGFLTWGLNCMRKYPTAVVGGHCLFTGIWTHQHMNCEDVETHLWRDWILFQNSAPQNFHRDTDPLSLVFARNIKKSLWKYKTLYYCISTTFLSPFLCQTQPVISICFSLLKQQIVSQPLSKKGY